MIVIAGIVGTGVVALSQRQPGDSIARDVREAGEQIASARALCAERPALCSALVSGAGAYAQQEVQRRLQGPGEADTGATGRIPPQAQTPSPLPAHPPLPPRRPSLLP